MSGQAPKVAARKFDAGSTKKLLQRPVVPGRGHWRDRDSATEQAGLAMDRLNSAYSKAPGQGPATLQAPKKFNAKTFSVSAKSFGDTIK